MSDKSEQLILVFVTFNQTIIDVLFVLQPEGGKNYLDKREIFPYHF